MGKSWFAGWGFFRASAAGSHTKHRFSNKALVIRLPGDGISFGDPSFFVILPFGETSRYFD